VVVTFRPAVGQLYDPMRESLPEAASWRLSPADVELLVALAVPDVRELRAVNGPGEARFVLIELPNVLVLCHQFGGTGWNVQPWQAARQEHCELYPPGLPDGTAIDVGVYLADARTGRVAAHARTTWTPRFTTAVGAAVTRHLAGPQDDGAAAAELEALFTTQPDNAALARDHATAACTTRIRKAITL
jgi:hypothetical protein